MMMLSDVSDVNNNMIMVEILMVRMMTQVAMVNGTMMEMAMVPTLKATIATAEVDRMVLWPPNIGTFAESGANSV